MQIYYKKIIFLTWAIAFATFVLRFALPHIIIFGQSEILVYSFAAMLGVIIIVRLLNTNKPFPTMISIKLFSIYIIMLIFVVIFSAVIFLSFGIPKKGFQYPSALITYSVLIVNLTRNILVVIVIFGIAINSKCVAWKSVGTIFVTIALILDLSTGIRSNVMSFYVVPILVALFLRYKWYVFTCFSLFLIPIVMMIFFITNFADQNLLETLMRFDMSVPVSILINSDIGWVASEYPMGNTYFPNVLNPIAKLFVDIPETNPGFLVHKAVGFNPSVTSYYAVSMIGEAIMNFPDSKVMWSIIIMLQLLLYIFLAKLSWRYHWKIESIALFTISSAYLIFHGFEDYFAVRIIGFFKIFIIFYSLTLVNRMIRGTLVT